MILPSFDTKMKVKEREKQERKVKSGGGGGLVECLLHFLGFVFGPYVGDEVQVVTDLSELFESFTVILKIQFDLNGRFNLYLTVLDGSFE